MYTYSYTHLRSIIRTRHQQKRFYVHFQRLTRRTISNRRRARISSSNVHSNYTPPPLPPPLCMCMVGGVTARWEP